MSHTQSKFALLVSLLALMFAGSPVLAQEPNADGLAQFSVAAEVSAVSVDYTPLNQLLDGFTQENRGRQDVAFAAIDNRVQGALEAYTDYLASVPVAALSREDQLAYWLNTRNILIVSAMADSRSRRRLSSDRGTFETPGDMWTQKRITVEGTPLSIDDIERGIVLLNFADDPNVIYGLYQGSQGGASLPMQAFKGETIRADLKMLGEAFVNSREGVRVRRSKAQVPAIYSWYGEHVFDGGDASVKTHLIGLADMELADDIQSADMLSTRKFSYKADEFIVRQQVRGVTGFGGGGAGGVGGSGS